MKNKYGFAKKGVIWMKKKVKGADRFALPISLNFKGESSFKTITGGTVSVVILMMLLGYSLLLLKQMINRENSIVNSITKIDNLIYNPNKYNLNDYNFIFGIYSRETNESHFSDPTYFTLEAKQKVATK